MKTVKPTRLSSERNTECSDVKVGLQQSAPLLFIIIMDVFAYKIDTDPPWAMLFADDLVMSCAKTSKAAIERENWR